MIKDKSFLGKNLLNSKEISNFVTLNCQKTIITKQIIHKNLKS